MNWKCGHPRTPENTMKDGHHCRICQRAAVARYRQTAKGREAHERLNALRLWGGGYYRGRAKTLEQAQAIRAHIEKSYMAFRSKQQAEREAWEEAGCPSVGLPNVAALLGGGLSNSELVIAAFKTEIGGSD